MSVNQQSLVSWGNYSTDVWQSNAMERSIFAEKDTDLTRALLALRDEDQQFGQAIRSLRVGREGIVATSDDLAQNLYILMDGTINLVCISPYDRRLVMATLKPGAIFGEGALTQTSDPHVMAEAAEDVRVWVIPAASARNMALRYPILGWGMLKTYSERLGQLASSLEEVAYRRLPERLAGLLLELSQPEPGSGRRQTRIIRNVSHQNLADHLGTYRETISALLRTFKSENLVELGYRWIRLVDLDGIQDVARTVF
ncbi:MAG: Crp/Fnr family transcriptional regulator [Caldilineaceae bacterium]|nr:Crp/Fnr family transcriptional regulator [Caldilineaceae bacterium]